MAHAADLEIEHAVAALQLLGRMGETSIGELARAVALAAFSMERNAKLAITEMIYQKPERGYRRTGTLRRGIMAASPLYDHSDDEAKARSGELARGPSTGAALDVVQITKTAIRSQVGSWISYARFVHDGTTHMDARPFFERARQQAQADLEIYTLNALEHILTQVLKG